ncbi:glutamate-5-semialdehyde dehydrogenase [Synechococcus elongatus IITB7]|uniref:glutamate-5-semialdehyde dehydrogenase n=1 Tax=Synechococcus elongatus TaxID=32046 RepID=UPI0030D1680F
MAAPARAFVYQAYQAANQLARTKPLVRSQALQAMAQAIDAARDDILEANTLDLEACQDSEMPDLLRRWLKLTPERLDRTVAILERLSVRSDPIQQVMRASFQHEHSQAYSQLMPLGVIAFVYEALPELAAIATGLCLRVGNSILLKGGTEAVHTNQAIVSVMQEALESTELPTTSLILLPEDDPDTSLSALVTQDQWIDLVIPYGRPELVQQVARLATAPVLRTSMGNCYLYWASGGELETVRWMILDSHASEPDAVNAIEKVLIDRDCNISKLTVLMDSLRGKGFTLKGDEELAQEMPDLELASHEDWSRPFLSRTVAFKRVAGLEAATDWINTHSSGHADSIVTDSYEDSRAFSRELNSAMVHVNASPRFSRSPRHSNEIALGMSNQKGYRRGRINLETLTTIKQVVLGLGQ